MSGKLKEVLEKLEQAKQIIKDQQAEIDRLNKLIKILGEHE
jgi:uncharacterized protein (DUF305 family)